MRETVPFRVVCDGSEAKPHRRAVFSFQFGVTSDGQPLTLPDPATPHNWTEARAAREEHASQSDTRAGKRVIKCPLCRRHLQRELVAFNQEIQKFVNVGVSQVSLSALEAIFTKSR